MNVKLILTMIRARYTLILFTVVIAVATTAIVTDLLPSKYVATASLVLGTSDSTPLSDSPVVASKTSSTYLATQLDIIQSRNVALKVVDALGLANDPETQKTFAEEQGGQGSIREWLVDGLLDNLDVEPSRDSRVVAISYEAGDAKRSADIANAFAQAYLATTLELMTDPARQNAAWFDEQLKTLRQRLLDSQARLTKYQQDEGIISIDERLDTETNRLNELARTYVQVQAEAADVRSRQLGENHPEYRRAMSREQAVQRSLDAQKRLILELKQQRDRLGILAGEVETNQRVYETTLQRYYQTSLESTFNQPNVAILNPAVPPPEPSSPIVLLNLASALLLGLLLGTGLALAAELWDRRVRTIEDVTDLLQTKVLASI